MLRPAMCGSAERIFFVPVPELRSVQVLAVDSSERLWRTYHESYDICTCLPSVASAGADWRYRGRGHTTGPGGLMIVEPGELHITTRAHGAGTFRVLLIEPARMLDAAYELGLSARPHGR